MKLQYSDVNVSGWRVVTLQNYEVSPRLFTTQNLWWYLFLDLSAAKLYLRERNQMIENRVQTSVFNLLTNSMSVNGQVYDIANWHAGFRKHFICEETLSHGDSSTRDQDISRIKYTHGANFTKLCRRHRETSTTINFEVKTLI